MFLLPLDTIVGHCNAINTLQYTEQQLKHHDNNSSAMTTVAPRQHSIAPQGSHRVRTMPYSKLAWYMAY